MSAAVIVNAAGAWADEVAAACGVAPLGIQPYRRTVLQLRLGVAVPAELPLVIHVGGEFYFKGESAGRSEERRVGKSVSVRVDLGGRCIIKQKKQSNTTNLPDANK